jgi:anti-anti-sigma factor
MPTNWSEDIIIADLTDEPSLSEELNGVLDGVRSGKDGNAPHVVLNFGAVSYVNSSNLSQLLKLKKAVAEAGRIMKICSVSEDVWSVFKTTGLDKVFRFAPDPLTALASLQMEGPQG